MSLRKSFAIGITALLVLAAFASVVGPALAQGDEDDVLYIAIQQDMPNFNYFDLGSNSIWKKYVIGAWTFESMTLTDPQGNLFPYLAETWDFNEDTMEADITLRTGVKFHDGTDMTADDVVYSYLINRDGTTYSSFIIDCFDTDDDGKCSADEVDGNVDADGDGVFEGIRKTDDTHVRFNLSKPYGQFFLQGLGVPIIPKHVWENHLTEDGTLDVLWNTDKDATIGTGPFKYDSGERNVFRKLVKFEDYWGKDFVTPSGHGFYPGVVDTIYLKLYSSLDTAILALKSGQVEHIPWTVTPGYVPDLIANPSTDIMPISDNGYFYYAFNMKREPMNLLPFRKAVSYCIDKRTITDRYMGGFGQPGDACEPPFWSDWYNSSVDKYSYDVSQAQATLTAAGFTGVGSALKFPDGRAVPPLVLMTPPADYDPVRIKAGEMIAKNLRGLGIDVVAKPVDFDTLVARMNAFDYDMLIIGWSLTQDPVGNVFDILGPKASSNYFAFWSEENDNEWYNKLGGVSTLADAETQALANQLVAVQELAKATFDRDEQIMYTKWAQGIVAKALPCNVLYYRLNNYAVSNRWTGWVSYLGELFHVYTVAKMTRGVTPPPTGAIIPVLNVPEKLNTGMAMDASVLVVDDAGLPVADVAITLSCDDVTFSATSGTTDAMGVFAFTVTADMDGYLTINAEATQGTTTISTSRTVSAVGAIPPTVFVTASPDMLYLNAGESTTVTFKATDNTGAGIEGIKLALDENLMGYGTVDKTNGTTDANGEVTITWTADASAVMNKHVEVRLSVAPETEMYPASSTSTVTQFLVFKNTNPSDWHLVKVMNATLYSCNDTAKSTDVTVMAMDAQGNPLADETLAVMYSNEAALNAPPMTVTTNATGHAVATITWADGIDTNATQVYFKNINVPNAIGAGLNLLYKGATVPTEPLYGGYTSIDMTPFLDPDTDDTLVFDVYLYDLDGNMATGDVPIGLIVGQPSDGKTAKMVDAPANMWDSLYDYAGLNVFTTVDNGTLSSGGYFMADKMSDTEYEAMEGAYANFTEFLDPGTWDYVNDDYLEPGGWYDYGPDEDDDTDAIDTVWTLAGYTVTDGHAQITIEEDTVVLSDNIPSLVIVPMGRAGFYATPDFGNFWWEMHGDTAWKTDFVIQRTMNLASAKYDIDTGILKDFGPNNVSSVDVWVYDKDNNPLPDVNARLYGSSGSVFTFTKSADMVTDATGMTSGTVTTNPTPTTPTRQPVYIAASIDGYSITFASVEMFNIPIQLYAQLTVDPNVQEGPATSTVTAKVMDEMGAAIADLKVTFTSEGGELAADNATTNAEGEGTVSYTMPDVEAGEKTAFGKVSMQAIKTGYGAASTSYTVVAYNKPPVFADLSIPDTGFKTNKTSLTLYGNVTDVQGIAYLKIAMDGGDPVDVIVTAGEWSHTLSGLTVGSHTVVLTAEDVKGLTATKSVTFEAETPTGNQPPELSGINIPATGFTVNQGVKVTFAGKATDDVSVASVKYTLDGGAAVDVTLTDEDWSFELTGLTVGSHTVIITTADGEGLTATYTSTFTVTEVTTNTPPEITNVNIPPLIWATDKSTFTISGKVKDAEGLSNLTIQIDSGTPIDITPITGVEDWSYEFKDMKNGVYQVTVTATDTFNETDTFSTVITVLVEEEEETNWALWGGIIIIIIIIVVLLAVMMMRKKPEAAKPEEPKEGQ